MERTIDDEILRTANYRSQGKEMGQLLLVDLAPNRLLLLA